MNQSEDGAVQHGRSTPERYLEALTVEYILALFY
jgi:hypothetical protein